MVLVWQMSRTSGVVGIILLLKLKKEKILFTIHGVKMIKDNLELATLILKLFQSKSRTSEERT